MKEDVKKMNNTIINDMKKLIHRCNEWYVPMFFGGIIYFFFSSNRLIIFLMGNLAGVLVDLMGLWKCFIGEYLAWILCYMEYCCLLFIFGSVENSLFSRYQKVKEDFMWKTIFITILLFIFRISLNEEIGLPISFISVVMVLVVGGIYCFIRFKICNCSFAKKFIFVVFMVGAYFSLFGIWKFNTEYPCFQIYDYYYPILFIGVLQILIFLSFSVAISVKNNFMYRVLILFYWVMIFVIVCQVITDLFALFNEKITERTVEKIPYLISQYRRDVIFNLIIGVSMLFSANFVRRNTKC